MNCGIKHAVWYISTWLHPNSEAYALYRKGEFEALDKHLKALG